MYVGGTRTLLPALCTSHRVTSPLTAADIIGDQLTGISTAHAYRRQLLQVSGLLAATAVAMEAVALPPTVYVESVPSLCQL